MTHELKAWLSDCGAVGMGGAFRRQDLVGKSYVSGDMSLKGVMFPS